MNDNKVFLHPNNNGRILNENTMIHHDQQKHQHQLNHNETMYHGESRYGIEEGIIEDFIMPGSDTLNDLSHLDQAFNKPLNIFSVSTNLITNEDYSAFHYNQMTNMMNNNSGSSHGHITYHTLQPSGQSGQNHGYSHPYMTMASSSNINSSYITLMGGNNNNSNSTLNSNNINNLSANSYMPKLVSRSSSSNSMGGSSASSSSSSNSSNQSNKNSNQHSHNQSQQHQNQLHNASHSKDGELPDYDSKLGNSSNNILLNDPAEIVRMKKMQGLPLTEEEVQLLIKDRQRKDNHNMIERRRRFNINDRIKDLARLLPKNGEFDIKQNKGSTLKASVDYIMKLTSESDRMRLEMNNYKKMQDAYRYLVMTNKDLTNRIKELEMLCHSHGVEIMNPIYSSDSKLLHEEPLENLPSVNATTSLASASSHDMNSSNLLLELQPKSALMNNIINTQHTDYNTNYVTTTPLLYHQSHLINGVPYHQIGLEVSSDYQSQQSHHYHHNPQQTQHQSRQSGARKNATGVKGAPRKRPLSDPKSDLISHKRIANKLNSSHPTENENTDEQVIIANGNLSKVKIPKREPSSPNNSIQASTEINPSAQASSSVIEPVKPIQATEPSEQPNTSSNLVSIQTIHQQNMAKIISKIPAVSSSPSSSKYIIAKITTSRLSDPKTENSAIESNSSSELVKLVSNSKDPTLTMSSSVGSPRLCHSSASTSSVPLMPTTSLTVDSTSNVAPENSVSSLNKSTVGNESSNSLVSISNNNNVDNIVDSRISSTTNTPSQ